ncbi:MAG: hypothetical protein WKG32_14600 [Gemmatimonadaceae bacterium]
MTTPRWDETWHRLREWTAGQAASERLAAQVLLAEGYSNIDPSHPLGGKDGGKDAVCIRDGQRQVMGVYFPRGQQSFAAIKKKFINDVAGARANGAEGFVFVTNQELTLSEREDLGESVDGIEIELYHLERVTAVLDRPALAAVRKQFLGVGYLEGGAASQVTDLRNDLLVFQRRIEGIQTGGDSFCQFMLYDFDLKSSFARNIVVIRHGEFPLHDLRIRVVDMDAGKASSTAPQDVFNRAWGELNAPADYITGRWPLTADIYYRIFSHARNGSWNQDLILKRSEQANCWLAATRILGKNGRDVVFTHVDLEFQREFGAPAWRR